MANEIRFQPPSEEIVRGHAMRVPVTIELDRPLKVRGIHATFRGAEETKADYTTTSTDAHGVSTTETHTDVQYTEIVSRSQVLLGNEKLPTLGNMKDALATMFGGGKREVLPAGKHPFEVEISIPPDAPPTCVGRKSRVFYELSIHVDVPLAFDLRATQSFRVARLRKAVPEPAPVRTRYPEDAGRGYFDSMFGPDVRIEMALVADQFRVGETIEGIVCVEPMKPIQCTVVRVRMLGIETSQAHSHVDRYVHQGPAVEITKPGVISSPFKQEFSLPVTASGPLTAKGKLFSIDWFVEVELDVPWAKDPKIRAPFVLL